jgi:predicted PurR-regulated permease PerM
MRQRRHARRGTCSALRRALVEPRQEWEEPRAPRFAPPAEVQIVTGVEWRRVGWLVGLVAGLCALVLVASQVRSLTIPLLVGFIIAYILNPAVDWLERRRIVRTAAVAMVFVAILTSAAVLGLLLAPRLVAEAALLPQAIDQLLQQVAPALEARFGVLLPHTLSDALMTLRDELREGPDFDSERVLRLLFGGTVSVIGSLFGIAMVPVFAFFLLRDFHVIGARLRSLLPPERGEAVFVLFRRYDGLMSGFVRGQLLVAAIMAVLYSLGFTIVGMPLPLLVGVLSGAGNLVPYFGTLVGLLLATLLSILHWQSLPQLVAVYGVFLVVQMIEGWLLTPRIIGGSVGLPPIWVIISVLTFGEFFGFFGILVAVPLAAALKILLLVALERYRASPLYAGRR